MKKPIVLFVLAAACIVTAQESPADGPRWLFWENVGFGPGSVGVAGNWSFTYQRGPYLAIARTGSTYLSNTTWWESLEGFRSPGAADFGLLGGIGTTGRVIHAYAALGFSWVDGYMNDRQFNVVGIPVEAGFAWTPLSWLGIGPTLFGNLNTRHSFGGVVLNVRLGKVR